MTITYHVTAKDLVAAYRMQNTLMIKSSYIINFLLILLPVSAGFLLAVGLDAIIPLLLVVVFLPFAVYSRFVLRPRSRAERAIKKAAMAGPTFYDLTITDEGLIEAAHNTKKLILWRGVNEVVLKKARCFILCEDKQTLVINIKQITAGAVFPFIEMVQSRIGQR